MNDSKQKLWVTGGVLGAVVIVAATWLMLISPMRNDTSSLHNQRAAADLSNAQQRSKLNALKQKSDHIDALRAQLQAAVDGLPGDSGIAAFTREVSSAAATSGVTVGSITVGDMVPYAATSAGRATTAKTGQLQAATVSIASYGPAKNQFAFIHALQMGARRVLVTSTQLGPGTNSVVASIDPSSTLTTTITVFESPTTPTEKAQLDKLLSGSTTK